MELFIPTCIKSSYVSHASVSQFVLLPLHHTNVEPADCAAEFLKNPAARFAHSTTQHVILRLCTERLQSDMSVLHN